MIDDLFAELAIDAVERLLSSDAPREEADYGLARVNSRLSRPTDSETTKSEPRGESFDPELEVRLLRQYLALSVDELADIPPRVHEWMLERMSHASRDFNSNSARMLTTLYFLFPESTVRHSVIGLFIQGERLGESSGRARDQGSFVTVVADAIDEDSGLGAGDRNNQIRVLGDLLVDFVDVFPDETTRALGALVARRRDQPLTEHLLSWSGKLGGDVGSRMRRAVEQARGTHEE